MLASQVRTEFKRPAMLPTMLLNRLDVENSLIFEKKKALAVFMLEDKKPVWMGNLFDEFSILV